MTEYTPPPAHQQTAPQAEQKKPWWKKTWVLVLAALLVGIGIGGAGGSAEEATAVEDTSQFKDQAKELNAAQEDLAAVEADLETIAGDVPAREKAVEEAEGELAKREKSLAKTEAAVAKREKAVSQTENAIEANTISSDGVYEVGVDIKAGTYKKTGGSGCYYAENADSNGSNIISNNLTDGPATFTVSAGNFFETSNCSDWTLQP